MKINTNDNITREMTEQEIAQFLSEQLPMESFATEQDYISALKRLGVEI